MLPTPEDLAKAYKIEVFDASGKSISFGNLVQDQETIVLFIREHKFVESPYNWMTNHSTLIILNRSLFLWCKSSDELNGCMI